MPKRTNEFQALVKSIYDQMVPEGGIVTESAKLWDQEAQEMREVDILISHEYAGHQIRLVIECRDHARKETVQWIDYLVGIKNSLKVDKLIAVSSQGFTKAAKQKARFNNIEAITMREAQARDWLNFFFPGLLVITEQTYTIKDVDLALDGEAFPGANFDLGCDVVFQGESAGTLQEFIGSFFREVVIHGATAYTKQNFLEVFKTREDIDKPLSMESKYNFDGLVAIAKDGSNIEIRQINYTFSEIRRYEDVPQSHYLYRDQMHSSGQMSDADGSQVKTLLIQKDNSSTFEIRISK